MFQVFFKVYMEYLDLLWLTIGTILVYISHEGPSKPLKYLDSIKDSKYKHVSSYTRYVSFELNTFDDFIP